MVGVGVESLCGLRLSCIESQLLWMELRGGGGEDGDKGRS